MSTKLHLTSNHLTQKDHDNSMGQAEKYGGVQLDYGITTYHVLMI